MRSPESKEPFLFRLLDDDVLWRETLFSLEVKKKILQEISVGSVAIALDTLGQEKFSGSVVFPLRKIDGKEFLIPQRFLRMVDFFISTRNKPTDKKKIASLLRADQNTLLTGGPGTGKSYRIHELIDALDKENPIRPVRVVVAAPTGKAVARFANVVSSQNILFEWSTIHRLLGLGENLKPARYHHANPLPLDLLIVDEISMVDLDLFVLLVNAIPPNAHLILAGDLNQLPAVEGKPIDNCLQFLRETGLVEHIELKITHRFSKERAASYERILAKGIQGIEESSEGIELRSFVRESEVAATLESSVVERFKSPEVHALQSLIASVWGDEEKLKDAIEKTFSWLKEEVVLTTRRVGNLGSQAFNRRIKQAIGKGKNQTLAPIIAVRNNYHLGIFNGDTGFIVNQNSTDYGIFESGERGWLMLPLDSFAEWEYAFAITIHKSQGSEFGRVFVVYEKEKDDSKEDNRLLYTAATRAKIKATVFTLK